MAKLTLLRHAPLPCKYQGCYNGWSDIPIDPSLVSSAQMDPLRQLHFDRIYSSDLQRCTETLKLIFGKDLSFETTPALREVRFRNEIEGLSFAQVEQLKSFDARYLESEARWHAYLCAERQEAFTQRLRNFLEYLRGDEEILICSHAGAIREMMRILGKPIDSIDYLAYVHVSLP